jgi:predicted RNA binding protein YcfA (HicA-like mRNA interferase family)
MLKKLGYQVIRQQGSHIRLEADHVKGIHRITVPNHNPIKIGTLNNILSDIADATGRTKPELTNLLFG